MFLKSTKKQQSEILEKIKANQTPNIPSKFLNDRQFLGELFKYKNGCIYLSLTPEYIKDDLELMNLAINTEYICLIQLSPNLKNNKDLVLNAVNQSGPMLAYASEALKNNKDVVRTAVKSWPASFQYASDKLKEDKEFVLELINTAWTILEHVSEELKNDKEVVLAAVRQESSALYYVSNELKNDKDVVLTAVTQNGSDLLYASLNLRNDRDVVLAALTSKKKPFSTLLFASEQLRHDKDIILTSIANSDQLDKGIPDIMQQHPVIKWFIILKQASDQTEFKKAYSAYIENKDQFWENCTRMTQLFGDELNPISIITTASASIETTVSPNV